MASNPFGNLSSANTEKVEDRLGGNFSALDTNVYSGTIKQFYAGASSSGARSVTVILSGGDFGDREYRETIYVTSSTAKGGKNTYEKDGKVYQLPGFIVANHLAQCAAGQELNELHFEEKMVNIYDPEAKKELPKSVFVATDMIGKEVSVAIQKNLESQTEKSGDKYVPKADGSTRETNNIEKVFNTQYHMTVSEAQERQKDPNSVPEFWDKWVERNKGKVRDKTEKAAGNGQAGKPGGAAPQSGNSGGQAPRTSLFGGN